jgi:preprotein translocase subunit Sec61beta
MSSACLEISSGTGSTSTKHYISIAECGIMAKKNDTGFQSSAGLMRYFDTEDDKGLKVSPRTVIGIAIAVIVIVLLANTLAPL